VPPRALSCPECGADEKTGWNEAAAIYDGLDLPEDADASAEVPSRLKPRGVSWPWWLLGVALLGVLAWAMLTARW
jgi:hypothetical protein